MSLDQDLAVLEGFHEMAHRHGKPELAQPMAEWYMHLFAGEFDVEELERILAGLGIEPYASGTAC